MCLCVHVYIYLHVILLQAHFSCLNVCSRNISFSPNRVPPASAAALPVCCWPQLLLQLLPGFVAVCHFCYCFWNTLHICKLPCTSPHAHTQSMLAGPCFLTSSSVFVVVRVNTMQGD